PPGPARLETSGAGELSMDIVVPPRPAQIRLQHSDSTAFTAGAILLPTGLVVGASLWSLAFVCGSDTCQLLNLTVWPVLGGSAFITGIVLLAMGKVTPANDANRVELVARGGAPRPRLTSFGLAPTEGGATGGLRFEF